ncbi:hypothetical protein PYW07_009274 [Mythimna separata]|uniref:Dystrophin n=1 Tax=Mythimna separata TaxID=271217 RepID=A0AAD8DM73_MYTSE|nr:hypothetical protein PYW07_009274 [Mythimna separata]
MTLVEDTEKFHSNVEALQRELDETSAWSARAQAERAGNNLLIHLRNRLRALRQLRARLTELSASAIVLQERALPPERRQRVADAAKRLADNYDALLQQLTQREADIKQAISKKPQQTTEDDFKLLQTKIQEMEAQIIAEHAMVSTPDAMEAKLAALAALQRQFDELQATYERVVRERRDSAEKGSVQELNFRCSLENLVTKFGDTRTILQQKINKLENGLQLTRQLAEARAALAGWLDGVEQFLQAHPRAPLGEQDQLELLLDKSNKFEEEKETFKAKMESIESTKEQIVEDCEDAVAKTIQNDTTALRKRYDSVTERALQMNESLRRGLERTEAVFRKIAETEEWLAQIEAAMPAQHECGITDSAELYQMKARFQALRDKCDDHTQQFRNLNETSNDILLAAEGGASALARRVTHLNARWTHVTHGVYERYKVLAEAWHESGELRAWLTQEKAWLDGLQRRLRRSPNAPADAEEISDELYDLENYIQNHSDERLSRIQDIGRQLIDAHIMPGWIQAEIDAVTDTWNTLRAEAASRSALLESAVREAARSEVSVDQLQQWLGDAAHELQPPRRAPPARVRALADECATQRARMRDVRAVADAYSRAGKLEAANRLADQLDLLQRKFDTVEEWLRLASGPADATPPPAPRDSDISARLAAAVSALQDVQRECTRALPLAGHEPDSVRAQLRTCLRFYRTLSEIKSEVESIIKTGRKMVEEEAVPAPQEFSKKIDMLKELYNKLGAQITESKSRLERALLTARELQSDLAALRGWLDGLRGLGPQTLELEMSRMEALRDKLNANYDAFAAHCEPAHLAPLRDQIAAVNARWEALRRPAAKRDADALARWLRDADAQLECRDTASAAKLRVLAAELRDKQRDVHAADSRALTKLYERIRDKVTAASAAASAAPPTSATSGTSTTSATSATSGTSTTSATSGTSAAATQATDTAVVLEYENVTDTIKRRLESPVNTPETEKPEFKKSKIPLALKSPVPIKKDIKEGGHRSRGSSLERRRASESPLSGSHVSAMSADSIEAGSRAGSVPSTPSTPDARKKNSSTFNLLTDSDLFTQINNDNIHAEPAPAPAPPAPDACTMVAVKEHEIIKSTVSPIEPVEMYPFEAVDAVVEFIPQSVDAVDVIDDTENESLSESDEEDVPLGDDEPWRAVDLGTEPKTFVVEVKTLEQRMKPTLGILKRKNSSDEDKPKAMRVSAAAVPDLIPSAEKQDGDVGMRTPPPTPLDEREAPDCPLLYDLAARAALVRGHEHHEYLILDDVPREQAALPEPSATAACAAERDHNLDTSAPAPEHATSKPVPPQPEEEVIYSEVEDSPQLRSTSCSEFEDKAPLCTSTPIKHAQVVAMSPKLAHAPASPAQASPAPPHASPTPAQTPPASPLTPPAPASPAPPTPADPATPQKSHIPVSKDRLKQTDKYQKTDDSLQESTQPESQPTEPAAAPARSALQAQFSELQDAELAEWEAAAGGLARRMDVMLLTVGGVAAERDPAKRLEILKNQLGQLAPDAAALISRGDSLVYARHKDNPLLADYIQTHFQDKLRNKWSMVMSEIELKRNLALAAEDQLKELQALLDALGAWCRALDDALATEPVCVVTTLCTGQQVLDVMSEIELKRNLALAAEDQLKELQALLDALGAWCRALDDALATEPVCVVTTLCTGQQVLDVMSEIELKRNLALAAEDQLKELQALLDALGAWCRALDDALATEPVCVVTTLCTGQQVLDVMSEIELKRNLALAAEDQLKELQALLDALGAWCRALDDALATEPLKELQALLDALGAWCRALDDALATEPVCVVTTLCTGQQVLDVMSEIELKRNLALAAEDQLKELQALLDALGAWCRALDDALATEPRNLALAAEDQLKEPAGAAGRAGRLVPRGSTTRWRLSRYVL